MSAESKKIKANKDGSFTVTETIRLTDSMKSEACADLVRLWNPGGGFSLCENDGYMAKSIEQKYGLPLHTLAEVSGYAEKKREFDRRKAQAMQGFNW